MPATTLDKKLLHQYLNHNCTPEELEQVQAFLKKPESAALLQEVLDEAWQEMEEPQLDEEAMAKYRTHFMAHVPPAAEEKISHIKLWQKSWLKYAAVIMLICTLGFYKFYRTKKNNTTALAATIEKYNPNGRRSVLTLSDSTLVYLGSNSKIRFPEKFGKTRELVLEGEAFFEVKKDPARPFIIHTANLHTQVLGTSFKIEAFKGTPIRVSVATGKVRVDHKATSTRKTALAILEPGKMVDWDEEKQKLNLEEVDINTLSSWKDGNLTFSNQRLDRVVAELARCYNIEIQITSPKLAAYRINTTCSLTDPINKIMDIISKTGGFKYSIKDQQITISN